MMMMTMIVKLRDARTKVFTIAMFLFKFWKQKKCRDTSINTTLPFHPLAPTTLSSVPPILPHSARDDASAKTETTEFSSLQKPEQNTEDKGKHEKQNDHDEHEHHHDKHDHSNNHGIMTNTTFLLPCCHCQVVKTTTHTYSYNYLHSREEGMKEKAGENSKKMMVDKRNIVFQKKE